MAKTYHIDGVAYPKEGETLCQFAKALIEDISPVFEPCGVTVLGRPILFAIGLKAVIGKKDASVYDEENILIGTGETPIGLRYTEGERAGMVVKAIDYGFDISVPTIDLSGLDESVLTAHDEFVVALVKSLWAQFKDRFYINIVTDEEHNFLSDDF